MKRREFLTLFGSAAAFPTFAHAQQTSVPVIGFLNAASAAAWGSYLEAFRKGLGEQGYIEGTNLRVEYRWAEGKYDRLPEMAADLVKRHVAVIVTSGGIHPIRAALAETKTIPIIFSTGDDPVRRGFVASLSHPGGNATGINNFVSQMESKRFGLLRELVPSASLFAVLLNPGNPPFPTQLRDVQQAARAMNQQIHLLQASTESELAAAFATAVEVKAGAIAVAADPYFNSQRNTIVALAAKYAMPAIYEQREHAMAGGLMSYGTSLRDGYRQVGSYTGRILKGEKPADLPVLLATKFEFVINLKTAKSLGLTVPPGLSARADEIIE
jgi:putative ABC transport system substrate-binding protein